MQQISVLVSKHLLVYTIKLLHGY